eukprot:197538_1
MSSKYAPPHQRATGRCYNYTTFKQHNIEEELFGSISNKTMNINFDKIPVEISGHNKPNPLNNFEESLIHNKLQNNIKLCQYIKPSPLQKYCIPAAINRRDIFGCCQSGSCTVSSFLLSIINQLLNNPNNTNQSVSNNNIIYPRAIIMVSTFFTAKHCYMQCRRFLYQTDLTVSVIYSGADWRKQMRDIKSCNDIIIATPGRLNDFIERGMIQMSKVEYNVLYEVDYMLDMGFMPTIKQIIRSFNIKCRTLMFSATFPREIQNLAHEFLNDYIFIGVGKINQYSNVEHKIKFVEEYDKTQLLIQILKDYSSLLPTLI